MTGTNLYMELVQQFTLKKREEVIFLINRYTLKIIWEKQALIGLEGNWKKQQQ